MAHNRKRRRQSAYSSEGYLPQTRSYQTRIAGYEGIDRAVGDAALSAYAALYGKVQHKLFAVVAAGGSAVSKKSEYIEEHGIPARLFNAARITLDGKVSAVRESQLLQLDSLRRRVSRAERQVAEAAEPGRWQQVHGKRRRLANLKFRLSVLAADIVAGRVRLCFGSKKLWRRQYDLEANGYASHEEWLQEWREVRSMERTLLTHLRHGLILSQVGRYVIRMRAIEPLAVVPSLKHTLALGLPVPGTVNAFITRDAGLVRPRLREITFRRISRLTAAFPVMSHTAMVTEHRFASPQTNVTKKPGTYHTLRLHTIAYQIGNCFQPLLLFGQIARGQIDGQFVQAPQRLHDDLGPTLWICHTGPPPIPMICGAHCKPAL